MNRDFIETRLTLKVSLHGLEAWRLYRAGAHPVLVFEMFPALEQLRDLHHDTVQAVLSRCHTLDAFQTISNVRALIEDAVTAADKQSEFSFQRSRFEGIRFLRQLYGQSQLNDDVRTLAHFCSFLVDIGDPLEENHSEAYTSALAGVWFKMCDAALDIQTQEKTV